MVKEIRNFRIIIGIKMQRNNWKMFGILKFLHAIMVTSQSIFNISWQIGDADYPFQ